MGTKASLISEKTKIRLKKGLVMFLIASLGFGLQLSYSTPVALSRTYYDELKISEEEYGLIFTLYSLPNVFMVIVGGILIDIMGTTFVSVVFSSATLISTYLTAISVPHYKVILGSRFLMGLGGETILACTTTMVPLWFSAKEVPLCLGFLAAWFYWGNLTALVVLPEIKKYFGFKSALWFVAAVFTIDFILNIVLIRFKNQLKWPEEVSLSRVNSSVVLKTISSNSDIAMESEEIEIDGEVMATTNNIAELDGAQEFDVTTIKHENKWQEFIYKLKEVKEMSKKLEPRFWLLSVICFISYYSMFGLAIIGTDVLEVKFGYDEAEAGLIMASEAIVNGILPMGAGIFMQKVRGWKIRMMMFACFLLGLGTLLLNVTSVYPLPWIVLCGMGFGILNTTLMSCVPLMVEMSIVGTAYGIICTSYNFNIVFFPPLLDYIKHRTGSYTIPLALLTLSSVISIILLAILKVMDMKVPLNQSLDSPHSTAGMTEDELFDLQSQSLIHSKSQDLQKVDEIQEDSDQDHEDMGEISNEGGSIVV